MGKFTADMTIAQAIAVDKRSVPIMLEYGMHCLGCPMANGESLQAACAVHGGDVAELIEKLNAIGEEK